MSFVNLLTKNLIANGTQRKLINYSLLIRPITTSYYSFSSPNKSLTINRKKSLLYHEPCKSVDSFASLRPILNSRNILFREYTTENINQKSEIKSSQTGELQSQPKKMSKFKQFYTQYGPIFLVVHLITVVLWIYGFFLISKQGYDITQLLNVFEKVNIMTKSTVDSIHDKINNYKSDSGWITGANIKHFATAYMVYKVIAPFRYMVSIGIVRFLVKSLRAKGLIRNS
ncbi:unnamed protein product [Brachionus calyciflorus]|uniref:DUF1279 domain-containing protein n=1 Tax=Brachionus calyciflorus TaxID=104777 RepID=A0A813USD3_9BILA|nr:unnamed protein product [Brachionus calyciflorus]